MLNTVRRWIRSQANLNEVGNALCPVTKMAVDAMGGPVRQEYKGKIYNLCCSGCVRTFKDNPDRFARIAENE